MTTTKPITKDTTIAELFAAHPKAEQALLALLPDFAHLQNPTLRSTITKVTTLERAAATADISAEDLLQKLRSTLGLPDTLPILNKPASPGHCGCFDEDCEPEQAPAPETQPDWATNTRPATSINADEILAKGESPLEPVTTAARELAQGQILSVTVAFHPTPMIQTLQDQGYNTYCRSTDDNRFELLISPDRS